MHKASEEFQEWLDVQSRFHNYSHRNTLLIKLQYPEATKVTGYKRGETTSIGVQEGEQAIWIWAPIITKRCPECENSPSYHEKVGCEYNETSPDEWSKGLVGFKPAPVFDVSPNGRRTASRTGDCSEGRRRRPGASAQRAADELV